MAHRRGGFAKKIDTVHWTGIGTSQASLAAGVVGSNVVAAQHLPETLLRIRGEWAAWLEGVQTGGAGVKIASGLILVPEGTGSTVLWSPITDADAPWIWWDIFNLGYEEMVIDVLQASGMSGRARVVDSKAMRKVRNTELQWVSENLTGIGAASVNVQLQGRVLSGS